jgi:hypothetical protein
MPSIQTAIYDHLMNYQPLTDLLGKSTINPLLPAIYDDWAPENTPMPYVNLTYSYNVSFHFAKIEATLNVDIFTEKDTVLAEEIRNNCLLILDRANLILENDSLVRIHYRADGQIFEPIQNITHWNLEFLVVYWRKEYIKDMPNK